MGFLDENQPDGLTARAPQPKALGGGAARPAPLTMDYSLAAMKIYGSQLAYSTEAPPSEGSSAAHMLFGIRFQRVWLQVPQIRPPFLSPIYPSISLVGAGVLLSVKYEETGEGRLLLDDGTSVVELFVLPREAEGRPWRAGTPVHKVVDLSAQPDREAMWYLEVAEAYNIFYAPFAAANPTP
ncbi:hypothetical protein HU200_045266 [Digitaria exilis]|uniref:Uncharacterized protein n=1 Tax=Digitaria exilis TaxID=1010633 RepID=A0A835B053_9POAL|nr:hypothetical protein HU200_045266 [Digitaria exilis]